MEKWRVREHSFTKGLQSVEEVLMVVMEFPRTMICDRV